MKIIIFNILYDADFPQKTPTQFGFSVRGWLEIKMNYYSKRAKALLATKPSKSLQKNNRKRAL